MINTCICFISWPMILVSIGFGLCFLGGIYAFRILTSDDKAKEPNQAEERLRAKKLNEKI